ncbi:MAG: hypothetical protein M0002_11985 [Rhodospirillales bacterium]|nr:hypothetical protein [Rhodospirillales bacterium]
MHFRVRGNSAHLLRDVPDPDSGKTRPMMLGAVNLITGAINDRAKEALTGEEIEEVETWLNRKQELDRRRRQLEAASLPFTLADVLAWIEEADRSSVAELADEILFGLTEVRRALTMKLRE